MSKDFPPKKRDWKPGTYQVGLFVRTPNGSVMEMTANTATEAEAKALTGAFLKRPVAPAAPTAPLTPIQGGDAPDSFPMDGAYDPPETQAEADSDWRKDT